MSTFKNIWNDPVWSKVIAVIISGLFIAGFMSLRKTPIGDKVVEFFNITTAFPMWAIFIIPALLIILFLYKRNNKEDSEKIDIEYDIFLSMPMASLVNDQAFQEQRRCVEKVKNSLKNECDYKNIYDAGDGKEGMDDFGAQDISVKEDIEALEKSKYFILIYQEKLVSSVTFEAGAALAMKKPSVYFVKSISDLPFLMQHLNQAFPPIRVYEADGSEEICKIIKNNHSKLFDNA